MILHNPRTLKISKPVNSKKKSREIRITNNISNLSGSYKELLERIYYILKENGIDDMKILLGGTIADEDLPELETMNVKVFPSGTKLQDIVEYIERHAAN